MILSSQGLRDVIFGEKPMIQTREARAIDEKQIQPASLDLRLGGRVHSMKTAGLPSANQTVEEYIGTCVYDMSHLKPGEYFILSPNVCYLIPLEETLCLSPRHYATFSPKSSIGRCGIFARIVCNNHTAYDRTPLGYEGPLYLEITSFIFRVCVIAGLSLMQMRIVAEETSISAQELEQFHSRNGVLFDKKGMALDWKDFVTKDNRLLFRIDLDRDVVGFEAIETAPETLSLFQGASCKVSDFWRPIPRPPNGRLILRGNGFYLLATKEYVRIPKECCAEIVPYDVNLGEFRTHYAGFFDNGFGGEKGTAAVLEVHLMDTNFGFFDGQVICSMVFQKTDMVPDKLYGKDNSSNYTNRGPSLSKFFKGRESEWR